MKYKKSIIALSIVGSAILFGVTSSYAFPAPGAAPSSGRADSSSTQQSNESGSESKENDELAYKICFYKKPNYKEMTFCRRAPSQRSSLKVELRESIKSIKLSDASGRIISGPNVQLKVCDKIWRRGNCRIFNSSQKRTQQSFNQPIASYTFRVR